jgi:hypothetical protein
MGTEQDPVCDFKPTLVSRETFQGADDATKLNYLFDIHCVVVTNQNQVRKYIEHQRARDRRINAVITSTLATLVSILAAVLKPFLGGAVWMSRP